MTESIKYAQKTARIIASFDTADCAGGEAIFCFKANSTGQSERTERIVDSSINITPDMARYWREPDWLHFLESAKESYHNFSQLSLEEVISVMIRFKMNPGSLGIYSVENTDVANVDGFNRFLSSTPRTGKHHEIFFGVEGQDIENAHDALEIVIAMGVENLQPVASDLPYVCMNVGG